MAAAIRRSTILFFPTGTLVCPQTRRWIPGAVETLRYIEARGLEAVVMAPAGPMPGPGPRLRQWPYSESACRRVDVAVVGAAPWHFPGRGFWRRRALWLGVTDTSPLLGCAVESWRHETTPLQRVAARAQVTEALAGVDLYLRHVGELRAVIQHWGA